MADFDFYATRTLMEGIEQSFSPSTLFRDVFFPNEITFSTKEIDMDYKKGGRKMAPFVVRGSHGVNIARNSFSTKSYTAPLMKPKIVYTIEDLEKRSFNEAIYSPKTPAQRMGEMIGKDMADLIDMNTRRIEWMCVQTLLEGSFCVSGFADDGVKEIVDTVNFDWDGKTVYSGEDTWDKETADIYGHLQDASRKIRRNCNMIPTVAIGGANIFDYMLKNKSIYDKLLVPSTSNLSFANFAPKIERSDLIRCGYLQALNLDFYTYDAIYENDNGKETPYIPDDVLIIGVPYLGRQLYGAISQFEDNNIQTYEGKFVPKYSVNAKDDTAELAMSTRCVPLPTYIDSWVTLKVK